MGTTKRNRITEGISLSVRSKDERYPIPVYLNDDESPTFTVYFNPGDPFIMEYAENLRHLDAPEKKDTIETEEDGIREHLSLTDNIARNLDAIFGDGSARLIFRYDGLEHTLIFALLDKVKEGFEDFKERQKAVQAEERGKVQAAAQEEAKRFIENKKK